MRGSQALEIPGDIRAHLTPPRIEEIRKRRRKDNENEKDEPSIF